MEGSSYAGEVSATANFIGDDAFAGQASTIR
jgi:hypothetical protein